MPYIKPGTDVIHTFKNQKTDIQFAIGEYIDNSIDSYFKNRKELERAIADYKPYIDIDIDIDDNVIVIEDNCAGIHKEDEDRAFRIGKQNPNESDIGTYGMGMKVSSFWFCPDWEVETKPLHENYKKTFKVNLKNILETGKTQDEKVRSDAEPYTKITLKNVYKGKIPKNTQTRNNIKQYIADMYRFMIMEESITIRFNGVALRYQAPEIFKQRYFKEKDGRDLEWLTRIPEMSLGKVRRENKDVELKILGGAAYIKEFGKMKGQKGFSIFWKKRLVDGHPQKPWMPSTYEYDEPELQIYGARNQYVAQRLEGYIHVSPDFKVPSTKDGIEWENLELVFIRKLKAYLQEATVVGDNSEKKYDFINQCKKISKIANEDREKEEEDNIPSDEEILDDIENEEEIDIPNDIPDDDVTEDDQNIFDGNAKKYFTTHDETRWIIEIKTTHKDHEKLYKIVEGPFGEVGDPERRIGLKINLGHPFIRYHFSQDDIVEQRQGIIKFCISLALGEAIAAEKRGGTVKMMRLIANEILDNMGNRY